MDRRNQNGPKAGRGAKRRKAAPSRRTSEAGAPRPKSARKSAEEATPASAAAARLRPIGKKPKPRRKECSEEEKLDQAIRRLIEEENLQ